MNEWARPILAPSEDRVFLITSERALVTCNIDANSGQAATISLGAGDELGDTGIRLRQTVDTANVCGKWMRTRKWFSAILGQLALCTSSSGTEAPKGWVCSEFRAPYHPSSGGYTWNLYK